MDITKEQLSEDFAVKILRVVDILKNQKGETIVSRQLCKSGTSIGANIAESNYAESVQDFIHKLSISQKECNETLYWLRILRRTDYIDQYLFDELYQDCERLMKIVSSIIIKVKKRNIV